MNGASEVVRARLVPAESSTSTMSEEAMQDDFWQGYYRIASS